MRAVQVCCEHKLEWMQSRAQTAVTKLRQLSIIFPWRSGDVFVLDAEAEVYEWHGSETDCFERKQALSVAISIKNMLRGEHAKVGLPSWCTTMRKHTIVLFLDQNTARRELNDVSIRVFRILYFEQAIFVSL